MGSVQCIRIADGEADTAAIAEYERDRRDLLRRGLGLGGAVVAASSIPLLLAVRNAFAQGDGDGALLESAVGLEQVAVFAYTAAVKSGRLSSPVARVARRFRDQEQEHADALTRALKDVGGSPPAKPTGVEDVDAVVKGLGDARTEAAIANFAIALETAAVAAYYDATQKLRDAKLLQTVVQIMANEGQHLVVLRQAVKRDPVPHAFETGEKR
ncbi:MAG: ferritin-like domain-containing protein [Actinomycetota bacterium]|nr:ferritin-like domain-containing protein [Actinomycetota bacterium]